MCETTRRIESTPSLYRKLLLAVAKVATIESRLRRLIEDDKEEAEHGPRAHA